MPRIDGRSKLIGTATYTGDLALAGLLHARLVLSPHASGRVAGRDVAAALAVPGAVAVLFADDLLEHAATVPGAGFPLAGDRVRFAGEPVAVVVAVSEADAADAAALVGVDYEPSPAVMEITDALRDGAPVVFDAMSASDDDSAAHGAALAGAQGSVLHPNVANETLLSVGDVDEALRTAAHVVRGRWEAPAVHQSPMETAVSIARPEPDGGLSIWTSTQAPFLVQTEVARLLGLATGQVRVLSMTVGGGFGLKIVAYHEMLTALTAVTVGRPVRLQLTRSEQFQVAMAAGCVADIELGCDGDGSFTAARMKFWFDHGARKGGHSRGAAVLLCGAYRLPAYAYHGVDVTTNKPPALAYRAPLALGFYHLESAIDQLAREMDIDPLELRLKNASRSGDPSPIGPWPSHGFVECLEAARSHPILTRHLEADEAVGVAAGLYAGAGGPAFAGCLVEPEGSVTLHIGYADITGTSTTLAMIAADVLGLRPQQIKVEVADTRSQPYGGWAGGSRTTYTVGRAVQMAAADARRQILDIAADLMEVAPEDLVLEDGSVMVAGVRSKRMSLAELVQVSSQIGFTRSEQGPIYGLGRLNISEIAPMATVQLCRVKVDVVTGEWHITEFAAIQDVGRIINRPEIEGQIHGGVLQSAGRVLGERLVFSEDGMPQATSFLDYGLPTVDQAPSFDITLIEVPSAHGPFGARGAAEPPAIAAAPAVANALRRATGLRLSSLPVEWEEVALNKGDGSAQ